MRKPAAETLERLAVVERVKLLILEFSPVQVHLFVVAALPGGCTTSTEWGVCRDGKAFRTQALGPDEVTVPLDVAGLFAGTCAVSVIGATAAIT